MATMAEQIRQIRDWVKQNNPPQMPDKTVKAPVEVNNKPTDLSQEAIEIGRKILSAVMADRSAYEPTQDPGFQLHPESLAEALSNPTATDKNGERLYNFQAPQVQYMVSVLKKYSETIIAPENNLGLGVAGRDLRSEIFPKTPLSRFNEKMKATLGLDGQLLYRKLSTELEYARNNPELYNTNTPTVQKIERGLQVYAEGRHSDALTILENVRNEDPHNKLVSYVLSNIFYHRAAHGNRSYLPQAREEAKKAATKIDKIDGEIQDRFRYNYIALDGHFGSERQLEVLRRFGFFAPPAKDASADAHARYIKCMVFLSMTPAEEWTDKEMAVIRDMSLNYIGGGLIFAIFFEQKILPFLFSDNDDIAAHFGLMRDILLIIRGAQLNLNKLRQNISEHFAENVEQIPPEYWTINRRLMRLAAKSLPIPDLYQFLSNTSLDGEHYNETNDLDRDMRERELQIGEYWDLWIRKLNYASKVYAPKCLPDELAIQEQEILPKAVSVLEDLRRAEAKLIDDERWGLSSHYQPKYSFENLAEVGLGHTYTSASFAPQNPILKNYHKLWGAIRPTGLLPTEVLAGRANAGAFTDISEVATLLEGGMKIINDAEYGIVAHQNKAWRTYQEMQNKAEGTKHGSSNISELISEVLWILLFVIPGAIIAFLLVAASDSMASGARMMLMVITSSILAGAIIFIIYKSKSIGQKKATIAHFDMPEAAAPEATPTADNDDEELSLQDLAGK